MVHTCRCGYTNHECGYLVIILFTGITILQQDIMCTIFINVIITLIIQLWFTLKNKLMNVATHDPSTCCVVIWDCPYLLICSRISGLFVRKEGFMNDWAGHVINLQLCVPTGLPFIFVSFGEGYGVHSSHQLQFII